VVVAVVAGLAAVVDRVAAVRPHCTPAKLHISPDCNSGLN